MMGVGIGGILFSYISFFKFFNNQSSSPFKFCHFILKASVPTKIQVFSCLLVLGGFGLWMHKLSPGSCG